MRLAHVSDLHFGHHDAEVAGSLAADIRSQEPDLVVASGDFTQIGSQAEFEAARAFLDTLSVPVFAVPGNHDVPAANVVNRFLAPYRLYRRYISDQLEPFAEVGGVAFAGLNSARRWRLEWNWGHGTLDRGQIEALAGRFAAASPNAVRVIVVHHPLVYPEKIVQREARVVRGAELALETFAKLGVRLVLSGHFHLSYLGKYRAAGSGGALPGGEEPTAPMLVVQASSAISTRLRGEPNSYNLIDIGEAEIVVSVREWSGQSWRPREAARTAVAG